MKGKSVVAALASNLLAAAALAHPGHGAGWLHHATAPEHVAPLVLLAIAAVLAARAVAPRQPR